MKTVLVVGAKIREEVFIEMVMRRELNCTVHIRTKVKKPIRSVMAVFNK